MRESIIAFFTRRKIKVHRIDVAGSGVGSTVYRAVTDQGSFAVKVAMYPERRAQVVREFEIRRRLVEHGFDFVPRPRWVDTEVFHNGASVYDFIEGNALESDGHTDEATVHRISRMLATLHTLDMKVLPDGFQMAKELLTRVETLVRKTIDEHDKLMNDELRDGLSRALDEVDGKLWLVDWENSCVEDVIEEIVSVSHELNLPENLARALFERYQALFPTAREIDFLAMSRAYLLPAPVCNICYSIDFLDVNLRHALAPDRCADELVRVAVSTKGSMADSVSDLLVRGAVSTRDKAKATAQAKE